MRTRFIARGLVGLGFLLLFALPARAGLIFWSSEIYAVPGRVISDQGEGGGIALPNVPILATQAGSGTRVLGFRAFANAPETYTLSGQDFSLILKLTDSASGHEETLSINGQFFGSIEAERANINATFWTPTTQRVQLGENDYTVSLIDPATADLAFVGPTTGSGPDSLGRFAVRVDVAPSRVVPQDAPEPSTLALAALGLLPVALLGRRRSGLGKGSA